MSKQNKTKNSTLFFFFSDKKVKAIYGYYTHCLYSCEPNSFESFVKRGKKLPVAQFDKFYNLVESIEDIDNPDKRELKDLRQIWSANPLPTDADVFKAYKLLNIFVFLGRVGFTP